MSAPHFLAILVAEVLKVFLKVVFRDTDVLLSSDFELHGHSNLYKEPRMLSRFIRKCVDLCETRPQLEQAQ